MSYRRWNDVVCLLGCCNEAMHWLSWLSWIKILFTILYFYILNFAEMNSTSQKWHSVFRIGFFKTIISFRIFKVAKDHAELISYCSKSGFCGKCYYVKSIGIWFFSALYVIWVLFGDFRKIFRRSPFPDRIEENNEYKKYSQI